MSAIKDENFAALSLKSNRCPVCRRREAPCPHLETLIAKSGLDYPLIGSENTKIFKEFNIPTDKMSEFDDFILRTLDQFTNNLQDRDYNGAKDVYKTNLLTKFYGKIDEFAQRKGYKSLPTRTTQDSKRQTESGGGCGGCGGGASCTREPLRPVNTNAQGQQRDSTSGNYSGISKQHKTTTRKSTIKKASPLPPSRRTSSGKSAPVKEMTPQCSPMRRNLPITQLAQLELFKVDQNKLKNRALVQLEERDLESFENLILLFEKYLGFDTSKRVVNLEMKNGHTNKFCRVLNDEMLRLFKDTMFGRLECMEIRFNGITE